MEQVSLRFRMAPPEGFEPRAVAAGVALVGVVSCGGPQRAEEPGSPVDELAEHGGDVCPRELPRDPDEEFAFGTDAAAKELPSRGAVDAAWVCTYGLVDARGAWTRSAKPVPVNDDDLELVREGIDDLDNGSPEACPADLGPLYLIVTVRDGQDLTGYAVDDFGCGSVRITDEPFETVPCEARQAGTVSGALHQGDGLLSVATRTHEKRSR